MSFVKGRRELCQHIKRVKIKGNGGRKPSNPETEPNFYLFPPALSPASQESGTMNLTKGHAESAAGSAKVEGGLASLRPPGPADLSDRPLAQLMSMGGPIQNSYPFSSAPSQGGGVKGPMQDLSLLSFLSNAKNNAPTSQSGVGSSSAQQPPPAASWTGAPYILTSTLGTSSPAPAFAPAYDAAASQSLQQSLLLQYSRRMEAEAAQARERHAILAMLLNATLPGSAPAPSVPVPAADTQHPSSSTASSLLRLLTQLDQQQAQRSHDAGENTTSWAGQEERGERGG